MKISTKVECGIIALIDICINSGKNEVVTVVNISKRQNISIKYLEQILPFLRHANIIKSVKGAKGGYLLSRNPKDINMEQVISALDCMVLNDAEFESMEDNDLISAVDCCLWSRMSESLRKIAQSVSLYDIAEKYRKIAEENSIEIMYYI